MPNDTPKVSPQAASPQAASILMATIIGGAVIIALVGTFVPAWIGLEGTPALVMQLAFYAVAALDVGVAFWLRARLRKARQTGGAVQRQ
jgi:fucose permease